MLNNNLSSAIIKDLYLNTTIIFNNIINISNIFSNSINNLSNIFFILFL